MNNIKLSFVISTRNRLEFLKVVLEDLQSSKLPDEEIVVIDANSSDGTSAFLAEQLQNGGIQQLLTEPDRCQAEGWNKGMLLSKGQLIKKITDDDVFDLDAIRKCKAFMLEHKEFDVCISNELFTDDLHYPGFNRHSFLPEFKLWQKGSIKSFFFSDPHMLVRKKALPYIGLYNPHFIMIDYEYALRISHLQARIVYYTGYNSMSYFRPETVSGSINRELLSREYKLSDQLYNYSSKNSSALRILRFRASRFIRSLWPGSHPSEESNQKQQRSQQLPFSEKYTALKMKLKAENQQPATFITHV